MKARATHGVQAPAHGMSSDALIHSGRARTIVGYGWPWTVRPGETIDFMVSADPQTSYKADLVRIICADNLSDPAMFKEKELAAPFSREYRSQFYQCRAPS